jgi:hypothetical protein
MLSILHYQLQSCAIAQIAGFSLGPDDLLKNMQDHANTFNMPRVGRLHHGYGNTRGVPEKGCAGTGTVCETPTRGFTVPLTAVSRVWTG